MQRPSASRRKWLKRQEALIEFVGQPVSMPKVKEIYKTPAFDENDKQISKLRYGLYLITGS